MLEDLTGPISAAVDVKSGDVVCRSRLDPDTLPDTTAGSVENVIRTQSLLPDGNHIAARICGIVDKYDAVRDQSECEMATGILEICSQLICPR